MRFSLERYYPQVNRVLVLAIVLFLLVFSFCMRPADDDLGLIAVFRERGLQGYISFCYSQINFRFLSLVTVILPYSVFSAETANTLIVPLVHVFWTWWLIDSIAFFFGRYLYSGNKWSAYPAAFFFILSLYFLTFQAIEIFSYYTVSAYYLYPLTAALGGLVQLSRKQSPGGNFLIFFCFAFAASGAENLLPLLLLVLALPIRSDRSREKTLRYGIALAAVIVMAMVVLTAPGTHNRPGIEQSMTALRGGADSDPWTNFICFWKEVMFQKRSFLAILCLMSWFLFSFVLSSKPMNMPLLSNLRKKAFILMLVIGALNSLLSIWLFQGQVPARTWFCFNFVCTVWLVLTMLPALRKWREMMDAIKWLYPLPFLCVLIYLASRTPSVIAFSKEYDQRLEYLRKNASEDKLMIVNELRDPGLIVFSRLYGDPGHIANTTYLKAYGIPGKIAIGE